MAQANFAVKRKAAIDGCVSNDLGTGHGISVTDLRKGCSSTGCALCHSMWSDASEKLTNS